MQSFCKIEYVSEKKIFINGKIINISNLTPRLFYSWKLNTVMIIYIYKDEELAESLPDIDSGMQEFKGRVG